MVSGYKNFVETRGVAFMRSMLVVHGKLALRYVIVNNGCRHLVRDGFASDFLVYHNGRRGFKRVLGCELCLAPCCGASDVFAGLLQTGIRRVNSYGSHKGPNGLGNCGRKNADEIEARESHYCQFECDDGGC